MEMAKVTFSSLFLAEIMIYCRLIERGDQHEKYNMYDVFVVADGCGC